MRAAMKLGLISSLPVLALALAACSAESDVARESHDSELGVAAQALTGSLKAVASFGTNPGGLKLYEYVPANLPANAPVVLALHGCTQGANDIQGWGWNELADQYGFAVAYPEQSTTNNSMRCFNWGGVYGDMTTLQRNKGENASLKQIADYMKSTHGSDPKRVYIVGFSAGAGSAVMAAAVWPDVFAAAASFSGIPYACPTSYADVFSCQNPGVDKTPDQWGAKVKGAFAGYGGPYPRMSVWQGSADTTVGTKNRTEIVRQWTNVHGVSDTPTATGTVDGATYSAFKDAQGVTVVESYEVPGMTHGVAVAPSKQCGATSTYAFDKGICASRRVAEFFGIIPATSTPPVTADGGTIVVNPGDGGTTSTTTTPPGKSGSGTGTGTGTGAGPTGTTGAGGNGFEDSRSPGSTCAAAPGRAGGASGVVVGLGLACAALVARRRRAGGK